MKRLTYTGELTYSNVHLHPVQPGDTFDVEDDVLADKLLSDVEGMALAAPDAPLGHAAKPGQDTESSLKELLGEPQDAPAPGGQAETDAGGSPATPEAPASTPPAAPAKPATPAAPPVAAPGKPAAPKPGGRS